MPSSDVRLSARIAKSSDYKYVARLCRRAVGHGDYVLGILKEVIADRGLFLAWSDGELVGMVDFVECIDGSGWLAMGRTDPDFRRRGVALFLQQQIAVHARKRGIRYVRLWALSNNTASRLASLKAGFRPVCEATHVTANIRVKAKPKHILLPHSTRSIPLRSLLKSSYLSKMNGYFAYKRHFLKANEKLLGKLAQKGELYADEESAFIFTKPERSFGYRYSSLSMLSGPSSSTLKKVKQMARTYGPLDLGAYLPLDNNLLSVARETGFRRNVWAQHCIVFEKKI
jgi:GNAT superfamily N-acetyltransferase